jgi:nitrogen-specific signal transduction histidine kinase/CheY-like chemotaxis protein
VPAVQRAVAEHDERVKNSEMQQRLQRAQQMEAVGTLAGGVAHDFNNILTIIMGHAALIPYEVDNRENVVQIGETIRRAVQRGADLVQQLASFARKSDSSFTSINPNQHIRETAELLRNSLPDGIRLVIELADTTPNILADPAQLDRVLINLVANSRDAMPQGGDITIATRMVHSEELTPRIPELDGQDYLCVSVSDTGCGMDEKTRQRIFEPFFTTKPRGKGTGLGLSVVYGLMQSHNGVVDVKSQIGKGTIVSLYFPPTNKPGSGKARLAPAKTMAPLGSETILIVEDEPEVRYFLKIIFQYHGYHVLIAGNAEEAMDLFSAHQSYIDLVFSDIGLPGMDGFELCAKLKPLKPSVKTILCSGYAQGGYKTKMAEQGIDAFIGKPYEKNDVLNTVRAILDKDKTVATAPASARGSLRKAERY